MSADSKPKRHKLVLIVVLSLVSALLVGAGFWCHWVYAQIQIYAQQDQAAPADAIGVLGAAEYDGRPSPVYRARLDHALVLYHRGIAPLIITLGGPGGDQYNEGSVGADYLISKGVPEQDIIAETESRNTEESARRISVLARVNGLHRLVIVSDGTHLFRIHAICAADGLNVLTSPRPRTAGEDESQDATRILHEMFAYTLWKMHLH